MNAAEEPGTIDMRQWYTLDQALARLEANSGRPVNRDYPRTLVKYGRVRALELGKRARLYCREDIDAYCVEGKRGPKGSRHAGPAGSAS